jgi:hypothetical protein
MMPFRFTRAWITKLSEMDRLRGTRYLLVVIPIFIIIARGFDGTKEENSSEGSVGVPATAVSDFSFWMKSYPFLWRLKGTTIPFYTFWDARKGIAFDVSFRINVFVHYIDEHFEAFYSDMMSVKPTRAWITKLAEMARLRRTRCLRRYADIRKVDFS